MTNINKLIEEIEGLMPEQLKDGTFAEGDYQFADALYKATELIHKHLDGYALVPIEPTGYMIAEGLDEFNIIDKSAFEAMGASYKAMIQASGES